MNNKEKKIIKVIPLRYCDGGFMTQAFAFGGTREKEKCENIKYGSSLQNFLIDDGKEVILSDTGMPVEMPLQERNDNAPLWMEQIATKTIRQFIAQLIVLKDILMLNNIKLWNYD